MASYQRKRGRRLLLYPLRLASERTPSPFSSALRCGVGREAAWMASTSGNAVSRAVRSDWSAARLQRPKAVIFAKCLPKFSALGAGRVRMLACASRRRRRWHGHDVRAGRRLGQPVASDDRAVQDQVWQTVAHRPFQGLLKVRSLIRQDAQRLVEIAVRRGPGKPEPGAEPFDIAPVPEPCQRETCLVERGESASTPARAAPAPLGREQPGDELNQFTRDVECANIGHARSRPARGPFLVRTLLSGAPRSMLRASTSPRQVQLAQLVSSR